MNVPAVPAPDITLVYTHQAYRALAASNAGAITPEVRADLWAKAEVNANKRRNAMTDIEDIRADHEYHQEHPTPPTVDVDALVEAHEPVNVLTEAAKAEPQAEAAAGDESQHSHEPTPVFDDASQTEAEKITASLTRDLMDKVVENARLRQEIAELRSQLIALARNQRMMPLNGAVEVMTLFQDILLVEQRNAADKELAALLADNWQLVPQLCASDLIRRTVFLQRPTRSVEPKPDADKPTNVRDFPAPDAELTTEDGGKSALACVPAAIGMGNGGVRRVGGVR